MEIQIQKITHNDLSKIRNLQPEGWPDIVSDFEFYIRKGFCRPIKACCKDRILGVGTSILFGRTAWLAHIIVGEEYRKMGIGSEITRHLLNDPAGRSINTYSLIATGPGYPVYKKAGFRTVTEYVYFQRDQPRTGFQISPKIVPYLDKYYSTVMHLDRQISGEDRKFLLADHLERTLVYIDNNTIMGYYIPGLGEGLIAAISEAAGIELMKEKYSKAEKAVLPSDNAPAIGFLKRNGFKITGTRGTRMISGRALRWRPDCIFSRIGGNFG